MAKPEAISEEFKAYTVKDVSEKMTILYFYFIIKINERKKTFVVMVLKQAPPTVYYIPDFITEAEEEYLLQQVHVY